MKETRHKRPCIVGFCFSETSGIGSSVETETKLVVVAGLLMGTAFLFRMMKMFYAHCGDGSTALQIHQKPANSHFKQVDCMVYELRINDPVKNNTSRMYVIDSLLGTLLSSILSNKTVILFNLHYNAVRQPYYYFLLKDK